MVFGSASRAVRRRLIGLVSLAGIVVLGVVGIRGLYLATSFRVTGIVLDEAGNRVADPLVMLTMSTPRDIAHTSTRHKNVWVKGAADGTFSVSGWGGLNADISAAMAAPTPGDVGRRTALVDLPTWGSHVVELRMLRPRAAEYWGMAGVGGALRWAADYSVPGDVAAGAVPVELGPDLISRAGDADAAVRARDRASFMRATGSDAGDVTSWAMDAWVSGRAGLTFRWDEAFVEPLRAEGRRTAGTLNARDDVVFGFYQDGRLPLLSEPAVDLLAVVVPVEGPHPGSELRPDYHVTVFHKAKDGAWRYTLCAATGGKERGQPVLSK